MKKHEWMFVLIISLLIVCGLSCQQKAQEWESILPRLESAYTTLQGHIDKISNSIAKIPTDYADKIEQLTRENEQLKNENQALKDYVNGFEDKFWKGAK